jgi:hypothetical protein
MQIRAGQTTFELAANFKGMVDIKQGSTSVSVDIASLRKLVAEAVRYECIEAITSMKPEALLKQGL